MSLRLCFSTGDLSPVWLPYGMRCLAPLVAVSWRTFRLRLLESCPISHRLSLCCPGDYGFVLGQEKQGSAVLYDEKLMWRQKAHLI